MTENRNERVDKLLSFLPAGRMHYFLQACTLFNRIAIAERSVCLPMSLGEVRGCELGVGRGQGVVRSGACFNTLAACLLPPLHRHSLPPVPHGLPPRSAIHSLSAHSSTQEIFPLVRSQGWAELSPLFTVSHNYHVSTKIKERVAFFSAAFLGYLCKRKMT